jgi:hypothetical protein
MLSSMTPEFTIAAAVLAALAILILVIIVARGGSRMATGSLTKRSRGPANLHFVCGGCGSQFTHTRRTIGAWEKGTRRFFCGPCHTKWRDKQAPRESRDGANNDTHRSGANSQVAGSSSATSRSRAFSATSEPAKSGCLTVVVVCTALPVIFWIAASYA